MADDRDDGDDPLDELDAIELDRDFEAMRFARMRTELDPDDPMGHLELGMLLLAYGKVEGADDAFEHVLAIEPGEPNARYWRAMIADEWGKTDQAMRELTRLAPWFPHAGDMFFAPLESMMDKVLRRIHAAFALPLAFASSVGIFTSAPSIETGRPALSAIALVLLAAAIIAGVVRASTTWIRVGGKAFRSLTRMILRRDIVFRIIVALDLAAAAGIVAMLLSPAGAWKPIGLGAFVAILVATALQAFTSRVPSEPQEA